MPNEHDSSDGLENGFGDWGSERESGDASMGRRPHPWKALDDKLKVIVEHFRLGCPLDHRDTEEVDVAVLAAAETLLWYRYPRKVKALAENARQEWWLAMLKKDGAFFRYDGVRPVHRYLYSILKGICRGGKYLDNDPRQRRLANDPASERQNPDLDLASDDDNNADCRQVALGFDPVDHRANPQRDVMFEEWAAHIRKMVDALPKKQRAVLIVMYWWGLNLAELAREKEESERALHMSAFHGRANIRRQFANRDWRP